MTQGQNLMRSTLLLVEPDSERQASLLAMFRLVYHVEIAVDGRDSLDALLESDIDLIVANASMSDMNIVNFCLDTKQNPLTEHIPIIVLAEQTNAEQECRCLAHGAVDYINANTLPDIIRFRIRNQMHGIEQQKVLELVSITDGLTGLANRMQLDTVLYKEWHAAIRGGHPISLLMIDIDHFKDFNDEFGHIQGDECLKQVASAISNSKARKEDFAARYGGEEFVLLLPYTHLSGAKKVATQLMTNIRRLAIPAAPSGNSKIVTVSVGVVTISPASEHHRQLSPLALLNLADKNLFAAKRSGRNKVCANEEQLPKVDS
jgi:diguanylate cyclase (GGDEF)-like protein